MRTDGALGLRVRPARPRDARALLALHRAVAAEGRWIRTRRVTRSLGEVRRNTRASWTRTGAYLVAELDGVLVGSLRIAREVQDATVHVATFGMFVAAAVRGRGVGSALLAEALRWAEEAGVRKVELSVYPDNDAARALYARFGFVEEGRLARHSLRPDGFVDEILMGRWVGEDA